VRKARTAFQERGFEAREKRDVGNWIAARARAAGRGFFPYSNPRRRPPMILFSRQDAIAGRGLTSGVRIERGSG
jgi:hypothetical protein